MKQNQNIELKKGVQISVKRNAVPTIEGLKDELKKFGPVGTITRKNSDGTVSARFGESTKSYRLNTNEVKPLIVGA